MSPSSLSEQKLLRLKAIRNLSAVAFVLSLTLSWITVWFAKKTTAKLEANPTIAKEEVLNQTSYLLPILVALGLIVLISGITTLVAIIRVIIKSKGR
ncbi:MAG: hypothetical protein ACSHYF_07445 [Verrucomicrobiaceae bacterium]